MLLFMFFRLIVLMKATWNVFCLCFKCLKFFHKKKKKIKNCLNNLKYPYYSLLTLFRILWTKFSFEYFLKIGLNWLDSKNFIWVSLYLLLEIYLWNLGLWTMDLWFGPEFQLFFGLWLLFPSFDERNPL